MFFTKSKGLSACRYTLIAIHTLIWVVTFPLCVSLTDTNIILIALYSASGFVLLIYIPAAIVLSVRDSNSRYDNAGAEVAYLSIQMALHLAIMIFAIAYTVFQSDCPLVQPTYYPSGPLVCRIHDTLAAMAIVQMILMGTWICWVSCLARRTPRRTAAQAFRLPAHRLIHREAVDFRSGEGISSIDEEMSARPDRLPGDQGREEVLPGYTDIYHIPPKPSRGDHDDNHALDLYPSPRLQSDDSSTSPPGALLGLPWRLDGHDDAANPTKV